MTILNRWTGFISAAFLIGGLWLAPVTQAASVPSTAELAAIHPAMRQVLSVGSRGHWVMTLQADLRDLGYTRVGPIDGIFGPKTDAALKEFEEAQGFPQTGTTSPAVWQGILAGFGLVPPYAPANSGMAAGAGETTRAAGTLAGAASSPPSASAPNVIDGRPVLKVLHLIATAYGPSLADNYPYGPVDAFGQPLAPGMVAVDPSVIGLRSYVYVAGYTDSNLPAGGFLGQAMDTGGAIKGLRIDIFMNASAQSVSNFGIEPVTVYVLGS